MIYFKSPHIQIRGRNRLHSETSISPVYTPNSSISSAGSEPQSIKNSQSKLQCPKTQNCLHLVTQLQTCHSEHWFLVLVASEGIPPQVATFPTSLATPIHLCSCFWYTTGFFSSRNWLWLKSQTTQSKPFQLISRSYKCLNYASRSLHSVTTGNQPSYTVKRQGSFPPNTYFACFLEL